MTPEEEQLEAEQLRKVEQLLKPNTLLAIDWAIMDASIFGIAILRVDKLCGIITDIKS